MTKSKEERYANSVSSRNYKDTVFRMLFNDKKHLLSLYNAVNRATYTNPEELVINTLENAVYLSVKNDVSCILDLKLNLYEHQSTVNLNMPLRNLFYVARMYEGMISKESIYSGKRILLPAPKFFVFYNGEDAQPERREFRLSDAYMSGDGEANLELIVCQLNINEGYNTEIKECCQILKEYTQYVERVRSYSRKLSLEDAVEQAVTECIREGILENFLRKNRSEVKAVSIFEYDEELHMKVVREEAYEEAYEKAKQEMIISMLKDHQPTEMISKYVEMPLEYVCQIRDNLKKDAEESADSSTVLN